MLQIDTAILILCICILLCVAYMWWSVRKLEIWARESEKELADLIEQSGCNAIVQVQRNEESTVHPE